MKSWTMIPFKHKAFFGALLAAILVSTCATKDNTAPKDATTDCDTACPLPGHPKVEEQVLSQENWSFKITGSGWKDKDVPVPEIKVAKLNDTKEMAVLFVKEDIGDATYQQYVVSTIKAFMEGGGRIDSIKQVTVSDRKAILVQFDKEGEVIWAWITVANGFGYGLTCGGTVNPDAGTANHDFCQAVADSLQIK